PLRSFPRKRESRTLLDWVPACAGTSGIQVPRCSIVAIDALAALMTFLRLDRQRRDRTGLETAQRDGLAGLLAIAVGAVVDPRERGLDLGDQLALAIARPQLDRTIGLRGGPVCEVGMILVLGLEMRQRLLGLLEDVLLPRQQLLAKVVALAFVHERLF